MVHIKLNIALLCIEKKLLNTIRKIHFIWTNPKTCIVLKLSWLIISGSYCKKFPVQETVSNTIRKGVLFKTETCNVFNYLVFIAKNKLVMSRKCIGGQIL